MSTSQPISQIGEPVSDAKSGYTPGPPVAGVLHTVVLLAFLALWAYFGRERAIHLRAQVAPSHLLMYLPTFLMEWAIFGYVVWGVRKRGVSLRELVGPRWTKGKQVLIDFGIAAVFEFVALLVLGVLAHLLNSNPGGQNVKYMTPVGALEIAAWIVLSFTAGICEETIFRGYLQRQFIGWSGSTIVGVLVSAIGFGAMHIYQGNRQAIVIGVYGAMFGILALRRRSLKPGMIAHTFQDSAAGIALSLVAKYGLNAK